MTEDEPVQPPVPRKTLQRVLIGAVVALAVLVLLGGPVAFLAYLAAGYGTVPAGSTATPSAAKATPK